MRNSSLTRICVRCYRNECMFVLSVTEVELFILSRDTNDKYRRAHLRWTCIPELLGQFQQWSKLGYQVKGPWWETSAETTKLNMPGLRMQTSTWSGIQHAADMQVDGDDEFMPWFIPSGTSHVTKQELHRSLGLDTRTQSLSDSDVEEKGEWRMDTLINTWLCGDNIYVYYFGCLGPRAPNSHVVYCQVTHKRSSNWNDQIWSIKIQAEEVHKLQFDAGEMLKYICAFWN